MEEMQTYDADLVSVYSGRSKSDDDFPQPNDIAWLVENLDQLDLRFAVVDPVNSTILNKRLLHLPEAASQARELRRAKVAAIFVIYD